MDDSVRSGWETSTSRAYAELIDDRSRNSQYLRSHGLIPNVVQMLGDCSGKSLLDIGCGSGWLLETVPHAIGAQCDISECSTLPNFTVQDVRSLTYRDSSFDVVVASMVLMWVDELDAACRELRRVSRPGATLVIAITHPFSYRTGHPAQDDHFLVTQNYGRTRRIDDLRIGDSVGPFTYYHRPLADYVNAIADAGWMIAEMREWTVNLQDYRRAGCKGSISRTERLPMFAFFRCR